MKDIMRFFSQKETALNQMVVYSAINNNPSWQTVTKAMTKVNRKGFC